jgi:hypothetical protein
MEHPEAPSGMPRDEDESQPLGPETTDPDNEAPEDGELPGVPEDGTEPPSVTG